ncbi:MAG: HEAT repeat domain-containing protein [Candidatus Omnitrophica bacterium]|nr:HEAT repeat domain-containing protein [Candidatus Omnitrophota bacterium]
MSRKFFAIFLILVTLSASACVERKLIVKSDPSGAEVFLDQSETPEGVTPLEMSFLNYGKRHIRLSYEGYYDIQTVEQFKGPWYSIPGPDFVMENLWPFTLRDYNTFDYTLRPLPEGEIEPASVTEPVDFEKYAEQIKDPDPDLRQEAILRLGGLRNPRAVELMESATYDVNEFVRADALSGLRLVQGAESGARILEMSHDPSSEVRLRAVNAMELLQLEEGRDVLAMMLHDRDPRVRVAAIEALNSYKELPPEIMNLMVKLFRQDDSGVRRAAVRAFGQRPETSAKHLKQLRARLKDWNVVVRRAAVESVFRQQDVEAVPQLVRMLRDGDDKIRNNVAAHLGELLRPEHEKLIIQRLRSGKAFERRVAAELALNFKGPEILAALEHAHEREQDRYARAVMEGSLKKLK